MILFTVLKILYIYNLCMCEHYWVKLCKIHSLGAMPISHFNMTQERVFPILLQFQTLNWYISRPLVEKVSFRSFQIYVLEALERLWKMSVHPGVPQLFIWPIFSKHFTLYKSIHNVFFPFRLVKIKTEILIRHINMDNPSKFVVENGDSDSKQLSFCFSSPIFQSTSSICLYLCRTCLYGILENVNIDLFSENVNLTSAYELMSCKQS